MESSGLRDNAYVLVSDVYYEGLNNFLNASKHTFGNVLPKLRIILFLLISKCDYGCFFFVCLFVHFFQMDLESIWSQPSEIPSQG